MFQKQGVTADTNVQEKEFRRQAQVYVFALLAHKDKSTIDPLNVNQWCFFTLPAKVLDGRKRSQHSITLKASNHLQAHRYLSLSYVRLSISQQENNPLTSTSTTR